MNILVAIFVLTFLFFLFVVFLNKTYNFGISDNSVVLTFVGIAVTFVIVSNYMQVRDIKSDIKSDFESKVEDVKKTVDTKIEMAKKDFENKMQEKVNVVSGLNERVTDETKITDLKIELRYYILKHLFEYDMEKYKDSLKSYMSALKLFNSLNEKIDYSKVNMEYCAQKFSEDGFVNISLNEEEKEWYIEIINDCKLMHIRYDLKAYIDKISSTVDIES
jgi:hypothetical protein